MSDLTFKMKCFMISKHDTKYLHQTNYELSSISWCHGALVLKLSAPPKAADWPVAFTASSCCSEYWHYLNNNNKKKKLKWRRWAAPVFLPVFEGCRADTIMVVAVWGPATNDCVVAVGTSVPWGVVITNPAKRKREAVMWLSTWLSQTFFRWIL